MFERFTAYARHVVVLAQEEARRLNHNYIGTEHILLGLLGEPTGAAYRVLGSFGLTLEGARHELEEIIGPGKKDKKEPRGHIPFTPRAKKVLELSLREALQLHHNYIGTEHILLGLIREREGVAVQIIRKHADPAEVRVAVLEAVPPGTAEEGESGDEATNTVLRWLRQRLSGSQSARPPEFRLLTGLSPDEPPARLTPASQITLSEAARLAGEQPIGSQHLLLAALADADSSAARALTSLGVDLEQAREALRGADVAGTTDEQPEEAGRRQMVIRVADDKLTIEAADPLIVASAKAALRALGDEAVAAGEIRGDQPGTAPLGAVWRELRESLTRLQEREPAPQEPVPQEAAPREPGPPGEVA
jgi:ATP-dependent Clp protease ATP-binding subunit ClpC